MAASRYDFPIERGTSFRLALSYKDENQQIINLTGYCARIIWKTSIGTTRTFSTSNTQDNDYYFSIDEVNGKIIFYLSADATNNFNFNSARYDLELQSPNDIYVGGGKETSRILYGTVNIVERFSSSTESMGC